MDTLLASFLERAKQLEEARAVLITRYLRDEAGTEFDEVGVHADFTGFMERAEAASQNIRQFSLNRMLYAAELVGPAGDKGQTVDEGRRSFGKREKEQKGKGTVLCHNCVRWHHVFLALNRCWYCQHLGVLHNTRLCQESQHACRADDRTMLHLFTFTIIRAVIMYAYFHYILFEIYEVNILAPHLQVH